MSKGYWIALIDVEDKEVFSQYGALSTEAVREFGGRFLVRGGESEQFEGQGRARQAVVEFDSYEIALACARSEIYQRAAELRHRSATSDIVIVAGTD